MSQLAHILEYNKAFVEKKDYEQFETDKFPNKKLVILTCMDARVDGLLNAAMGLEYGDAKIIKNAGAVITHPFGSVMRSILVAVYQLGAEEVLVVGHTDCGMQSMDAEEIIAKARASGVAGGTIETLGNSGIDLRNWLTGFACVDESVAHTVNMIRKHPLLPAFIAVHGLVMNPVTGELRPVDVPSAKL